MEKMELNSITLICQSTTKTILIPTLVILGLGTLGVVVGYTIAFFIAGLMGLLLMWTLYKTLPKAPGTELKIMVAIKTMFKYGLPLSIATILSGFLTQFLNFILAVYATDSIIGNYSVASSFVVLITFFATPVTTMMFPAFSKLDPQKDQTTMKNVFRFSVKYGTLLVVPAATIVMALSQPAVNTLFGDKYGAAPLFLTLLAIVYLYSAFGNLSIGTLINGQGHTTLNLKLTLLTSAMGFPLGFIMISQLGILGLITTILVAGLPSLIISLHWIKKHYSLTVDSKSSAKILLSSAIAGFITYAITSQLSFLSSWINLIIGLAIFLPILITTILLTRTLTKPDLIVLREMVSEIRPLRHLLNSFLNILEKLMTLLRL
jgi:O-antigen/teichoic acid export membrane protein